MRVGIRNRLEISGQEGGTDLPPGRPLGMLTGTIKASREILLIDKWSPKK